MPDFPFPLMIFAAGFGTRMGLLTADSPKPMIPVAGRPLIDHALEMAAEARAGRIVVNTHYLANRLTHHLAKRPVQISHEPEILETGGGLKAALPLLGTGPVAVLNSDAVWTGANPLIQLAQAWDSTRMEALLLLRPQTKGDFRLDQAGRIDRGHGGEEHLYLGACIIAPDRIAAWPETKFSLNRPWDAMIAAGTAYGVVHQGGWCDVGRPEGIAEAERLLHDAAHG